MIKRYSIKLLKQKRHIDFSIILISLTLCLFGLLMIFEASNVVAFKTFGDKYHFVKEQFLWFVVGSLGLVITTFIPYKKYYSLSIPAIFFTIITLILVLLPGFGIKALGATRWLNIGLFIFQPSEVAKLALILYLSSWFTVREKGRLLPFLFLLLLIVGLVVLQPDLGTAIILCSIFITVYFLSGATLWHFLLLIPLVGTAVFYLAITSAYRFTRLISFLNPNLDPLGASYHIRQILIATGSGGLWGLGLGASRQKYQYLPEATTDSIFAIIGEEFGFLGCTMLILFFLLLLYRIFHVVKHAPDKQSFLLSGGILTLIGSQIIINLGSMVALFPLTGVPLPFISYGGSNLIVSLTSIGIILNISRYRIYHS